MSHPEEVQYDKFRWPAGPWDDEPDRVDWIHEGLACMLIRNPIGAWCGYVGVPREHPAYDQSYWDVDVDVHGGLTYSDRCAGHICHVPQEGMPDDVFWFGFDCAHSGDVVPGLVMHRGFFPGFEPTYKNVGWAKAETERLAEQLAVMACG